MSDSEDAKEMWICAKFFDGSVSRMCVTKDTTIYQLKEAFMSKPDHYQVIYDGRVWADDKTLERCGMEDNALIHLIENLRGD